MAFASYLSTSKPDNINDVKINLQKTARAVLPFRV